MGEEQQVEVVIVDVDPLMLRTLDIEGLLCFRCHLLEDPRVEDRSQLTRECPARGKDLEPVVTGPRSGIKAALAEGRIIGYAIFGPPALFPNLARYEFEPDEEALFLAALYAEPEAREQNLDVDLLVAVMDFAREYGFEKVQAACRDDAADEPEARNEVLAAAGFGVSEPVENLCFAEISLADWDAPDTASEAENPTGGVGV